LTRVFLFDVGIIDKGFDTFGHCEMEIPKKVRKVLIRDLADFHCRIW
jgi:hypothetical protein